MTRIRNTFALSRTHLGKRLLAGPSIKNTVNVNQILTTVELFARPKTISYAMLERRQQKNKQLGFDVYNVKLIFILVVLLSIS